MTTISLFKKRGDYLSLRSLPGKGAENTFVNLPRFSFSTPKGTSMSVPSRYKDVPNLPLKIKILKHQIQSTKNYIAGYLPDPLALEEVLKGKDQLRRQEKLLKEMEEVLRCQ